MKTIKNLLLKRRLFNALIPGGGYLYVRPNAIGNHSFSPQRPISLQPLSISSPKDILAAGIIATSFEAGWYFGGIYGAGEAAKLYNERLYESYVIRHLTLINSFLF